MAETWNDLMARAVGYCHNLGGGITYSLDNGETVSTMPNAVLDAGAAQAVEMTRAEVDRRWAEIYVPGEKYQEARRHQAEQIAAASRRWTP